MKRVLLGAVAIFGAMVLSVCLWMSFAPTERVAATLLELERGRSGFEVKEVAIPGFRVEYMEAGEGDALVLLHGFGGDKDHWTRVAPYLTPHFRVIAVDLPGFGESDKPRDRDYTPTDEVAYLHAIIEALGLETFHLGGNSMGGLIAAKYAAAYPTEVESLWLLAPGGVGSGPIGELATLKRGDHVPLLARTLEDTDHVLALVTRKPPYVPRAVKRALAERGAADYDLHMRVFYEINDEWSAMPLEKRVAGLQTPTRIVWGEADRLLPVADADVLRAAMPKSSVLRLPDIGHVPMIESPQTVAEDYVAFTRDL
jgi:pimeloyl-ACP methyl ester carboxylesterase